MMWDFISLRHETCHQVSFLFSDRGIPNGYRYMNGYGSHTYKNINSSGQAVYVKYHFNLYFIIKSSIIKNVIINVEIEAP